MMRLLLAHGADPNMGKEDYPPLVTAGFNKELEMMELLLASKADPDRKASVGHLFLGCRSKLKIVHRMEVMHF